MNDKMILLSAIFSSVASIALVVMISITGPLPTWLEAFVFSSALVANGIIAVTQWGRVLMNKIG